MSINRLIISPTPSNTATNTPTLTNTSTACPTPTNTPTQTSTPTQTNTPTITQTSTNTPTITQTNTNTPTNTATSTTVPTSTPTPTMTPTPCICFPSGSGFTQAGGFGFDILSLALDQSLNRMYVGGDMIEYNGTSIRFLTALDLTTSNIVGSPFNTTGLTNNTVWNVKVQPDSKVLIGGSFTTYSGVSQNRLTRINPNGFRDTTFNIGTGFNNTITSILVDTNNKILVGGSFTTYSGNSISGLVRLNSDGSLDTTFSGITTGFGGLGVVGEIIEASGKYYIGGQWSTYNGSPVPDVIRLNSDGSLDTSFSATTYLGASNVRGLGIQSSGKPIIAEDTTVRRLNTDGSVDTTFTATSYNAGLSVVNVLPDDKILVGGRITNHGIRRVNPNGGNDTTFNTTMTFANQVDRGVQAIVITDDCYFIGGDWTELNGQIGTDLARLYSDGALDICNPIPVSPTPSNTPTRTPTGTFQTTPSNTPSITPTNTTTPTLTPSMTPLPSCMLSFDFTDEPAGFDIPSGSYVYSGIGYYNTGLSVGWYDGPTPLGDNYSIYVFQSGITFYNIIWSSNNDGSNQTSAIYATTGASLNNGGVIDFSTLLGANYFSILLKRLPEEGNYPGGDILYSTNCITPTQTRTPTQTATPTNTPSQTSTLPIITPSNTPTLTQTNTPTNTNTPTMTNTPTSTIQVSPTNTPTNTETPTTTPTPTGNCPATIYTHGAIRGTCSDYCNTNYLIQTTNCASQSYAGLTIGDFIYGYPGQSGYLAYSNVSTDTNTGPFRIADIDGTGEILGIYVCSGGSCIPL